MLKKIYLKNYKSFKELNFEVKRYKDSSEIYLIYGENGSGKSNLISSVHFLVELTRSLSYSESFKNYFAKEKIEDKDIQEIFIDIVNSKNINHLLKDYKRIGSDDEMEVGYTFIINEKEYLYSLVFNNEKLVNESLTAPIVKNKVLVYEIDYRNNLKINFNNMLFSNNYQNEIKQMLKKYFSKQTLLSIIEYEKEQKNKEYLLNNINSIIFNVLDYINDMSVLYKEHEILDKKIINTHFKLLRDIEIGIINKDEVNKLEKTEEVLDIYFKSLYSDVKKFYYLKNNVNNEINYELYLKKMVGGKLVDIPFRLESRGTKKLLELFPYFIKLLNGGVVVIDELEAGVHDILISILINKLANAKIKGQLIVTTHNTALLDIVNKNQIYILDVDDLGNKEIYSLRDSGVSIQPNHSIYNNYKKGAFGGVPNTGYLDFDDINDCLKDIDND